MNGIAGRGQSSVEYLVIFAGVVAVMFLVPDGIVDDVLGALARAWSRITEGVSRP